MSEFTLESAKTCLRDFCAKYDFPTEAEDELQRGLVQFHAQSSCWERLCDHIDTYHQQIDQDFTPIFEEQSRLGTQCGVHPFTVQMLYLIFLTPHLHELYRLNGYDDFVFDSSVLDLKWKLFECKAVYNVWGIFVAWWTIGFFKLKRFGLGRLQFNPRPCPYAYKDGELVVQPDDITLDTHIPSSGPLIREDYLKSYERAEEFFASYFTDRPTVFNCHSWLLCPNNEKFLPPTSRILTFARDYRIVVAEEDPTNSNSWRIFNTMKQYDDPTQYPQENTLQKCVVSWLKQGNNIGQGYGLIFYKNGRII